MEATFMQNFGGTNKECYGIFESGLWCFSKDWSVGAHLVAYYLRCRCAYMKLNKKKSCLIPFFRDFQDQTDLLGHRVT